MFTSKQAVASYRSIGCLTLALLSAPALAQCDPEEVQELTQVSQQFGRSVALDGDTLVVGASSYDSPFEDIGVVYVYQRVLNEWTLESTLAPADGEGDDLFGYSVSLQDNTLVVGALRGASGGSSADAGAVYVFVRSEGVWDQQAKLVANPSTDDDFGESVAIDGDTLISGADNVEKAYVYVRVMDDWDLQQVLEATETVSFGDCVAIDGDTAIVSDPGFNGGHGAAFVFVRNAGLWTQQAQFVGPADGFGGFGSGTTSVVVEGDTAVVGKTSGAHSGEFAVGSAYVFSRSGETWSEGTQLVPPDPVPEDWFGYAVAMDGDQLLVGAPSWYDGGLVGRAFLYLRNKSIWTYANTITPSGSDEYDQYASTLALDTDTAMIGSIQGDSVFAFLLNCESQLDTDGDKIPDLSDNCPFVYNPDQADLDGDGIGDVCDDDIDGDGVLNDADVCENGPAGAPVNEEGRPIGDSDADCNLDLTDYAAFYACFNGPNTPPGGLGCRDAFNTDGDIDIDLVDWANFQRFFTGG